MGIRRAALAALAVADPGFKVEAVARIGATGPVDRSEVIPEPIGLPGRPSRPRLVPAALLPTRSVGTPEGRAALLHSLAHIEFNAINIALDAIWRFPGLPEAYYHDWLQVAGEEANHFTMLVKHLAALGIAYGDFDAHDGLWTMAERTRDDALARMALVPRVLEARGLDATPAIRVKLASCGDAAAVSILDRIFIDEIEHVAIGNRWYRHLCGERGLDPVEAATELAAQYNVPGLRGPFNLEARRRAGFDEREIEALAHLIPRRR
jgi:uncharacterized ferritin-like protein (DUF455 family)